MKRKIILLAPAVISFCFAAGCQKEGPITYTISFNSQAGSKVASQDVVVGTKVIEPKNPTKIGYSFKEWTLDREGQNKYNFDSEVSSSFELYAQWIDKFFVVTFDPNGGFMEESQLVQSVREGDSIKEPTYPIKDGCIFKEWQLNGATYDITSKVTCDITLKAKYDDNKYQVETLFDTEKGTIEGNGEYKNNELATLIATPNKGYDFVGWFNEDGSRILTNNPNYSFVVSGDTKLNAKFKTHSYTITYHNVTRSEHFNQEEYTIETPTITLKPASRFSYNFISWHSDSEFTEANKVTEIKTDRKENIDLYAKWEKTTNPVVIFDTLCVTDERYGSVEVTSASRTLTYDPKYQYNPVWATFDGWYYDEGSETKNFVFENEPGNKDATVVNSNMYVYAKYSDVQTKGTEELNYSLNSTGGCAVQMGLDIRRRDVTIPCALQRGSYYILVNEIQEAYNSSVTRLFIPPTIETIDNRAFSNCNYLRNVIFNDVDQSNLQVISSDAFREVRIESITIPSKVIYIGARAFLNTEGYYNSVRIDSSDVANFTNNGSNVFTKKLFIKNTITLSNESYVTKNYNKGSESEGYITYTKK